MSIGAITGLASAALPIVGEAFKAVTEIAKTVGELAKSQAAGKAGGGDQNKVAHENSHSHEKHSMQNSYSHEKQNIEYSAQVETVKRSVTFQS
ncbi:hypothetical protein AO391_02180 [Pseudomonas marginalis ICMP 9505]|uniref:hypothetical protein n=1 Tax=Pseudomonas kitaguniensis TaxID=2607908 RepID=UPI000731C71C|nr:hypothetical protein [Pseudomonas kitaguniensis]KTC14590.1 hypothetical protein AO391_02180 [Pseudomonas marginalis ICMP 9505]